MKKYFLPKLLTCFGGYTKMQFLKDVIAGFVVAIIAIPLSIAIGVISIPDGVSLGFTAAECGLYTAIIGGFLVSFFSGGRVQIGGPSVTFVVIVLAVISKYGLPGLIAVTSLAGFILIVMGFLKMGTLIKYIPLSVTSGFTTGIAVVLAVKQLAFFTGAKLESGSCLGVIKEFVLNLSLISIPTLIVGLIAVFILIIWPKLPFSMAKTIPGSLIAILLITPVLFWGNNVNDVFGSVVTLGQQCDGIKAQMPKIVSFAGLSMQLFMDIAPAAFAIAMLSSIESLLAAAVADGMIGGHNRSNTELIALGIANVGSSIFGGIPVASVLARTAANVRSGGRTPIAGMFHAIFVLIIMLIFMPCVKLIPMTVLSAILLMVCYNIGEWRMFKEMLYSKSDFFVFVLTFILTISVDLETSISVGMVITSFIFMKRMANITRIEDSLENKDFLESTDVRKKIIDKFGSKVQLLEIHGAMFFGAADKVLRISNDVSADMDVLVLSLEGVPLIDASGIHALSKVFHYCKENKIDLFLCGLKSQPSRLLKRSGLFEKIGEKNIISKLDDILEVVEHVDNV